MGKVKNLYIKWSRLKGSMSPECQELNRLFSQCVDGNRIKVPSRLEDPPSQDSTDIEEPFVLDHLHDLAKEAIASFPQPGTSRDLEHVDALEIMLSSERQAISEFDLIQMCVRWCRTNRLQFHDYSSFFDYSALSDEQKIWLVGSLPPSEMLPSLVRNGLSQSHLVTPAELRVFKLDYHGFHWKPVFCSSAERIGRFLPALSRSMELFHKKLIFFRVDERMTLAIYVPSKIAKASEVQVDATVRVFALPRSQGAQSAHYRVKATRKNYRLYHDDNIFQLYDGHRRNTWIFLGRSVEDDASFRNIKSAGDRRRAREHDIEDGIIHEFRASVALDKISQDIRTHVGRMNKAGIVDAVSYFPSIDLELH